MSHHVVEASGLKYVYPGGREALSGVTFKVFHGEAVAVVGANGSGKTTLLLHLAGVLLPTEGTVRIGEVPLTKSTLPAIRQRVGLVFQDPDDQLFMPTVYEDVAFGPRNLRLPMEEVDRRVKGALAAVGIEHLAERPPYRLSGGEKRAAAIAAVLAMGPDVLLMDEPTSSLDPRSRRRVIGYLQSFSHTKIIATHDLDMAYEVCARTIVLCAGQVIADGPTKEILADAELMERCGLELPLSLQNCPACGNKKMHFAARAAVKPLKV